MYDYSRRVHCYSAVAEGSGIARFGFGYFIRQKSSQDWNASQQKVYKESSPQEQYLPLHVLQEHVLR